MDALRSFQLSSSATTDFQNRTAPWTAVYHLMRADLLERTRRYGFLLTLGFVIFVAYIYLPARDASYMTMGLGNHRGVYNSAWIGGAIAVLCSTLLSLPAFYLVKDAIQRDRRTRVGQILATTPLSKPLYTLGKAFSNFVFLAVAVGVIACASMGMQLIRGEEFHVDFWALFSPFLFCALPAMAMIGAIAILFETISWLRGTIGNVLYFFLWLGMLTATAPIAMNLPPAASPGNDLFGVSIILASMKEVAAAAFPSYSGSFLIGGSTLSSPLQTFTWEGVHWTAGIILGRLLWVGAAIGLALIASIFFRRFDPSPEKETSVNGLTKRKASDTEREMPDAASVPAAAVRLSPVGARGKARIGTLLVAELRLMLKGMRWWWYLGALELIAAGLLVPTKVAQQLLLVTWLWPLPLWSSLGSREARGGTGQLVFSTPHLLPRQLPALWLSGVAVAAFTGIGVAANFVMAGQWTPLLAWGTATIFIPALALALGVLSGSNKLFEVVYMVWWYAGPVNGMPALDFMGARAQADAALLPPYWVGAVILLALAVVGRLRQVRAN